MMREMVYLNGLFTERDKALISPDDRGFNFADGVYEVVKYYGGRPFRFEDHIDRLRNSLREVRIVCEKLDELAAIGTGLLQHNHLSDTDAGVYIQVTRGAHPRVHHFPGNLRPTVYICSFPFPSFHDKLRRGIKVITARDIRWLRCDIKSISLLPNTMLYQEASEKGAGECILVRDGMITEATHSTVFGVMEGTVYTHPLSNLILPGITRRVVVELCMANGIPVIEEPIRAEKLTETDELFIAGTGSEIMPVVQSDAHLIGDGSPGPITMKLQKLFFDCVNGAGKA